MDRGELTVSSFSALFREFELKIYLFTALSAADCAFGFLRSSAKLRWTVPCQRESPEPGLQQHHALDIELRCPTGLQSAATGIIG